jgi:hypothetical protein
MSRLLSLYPAAWQERYRAEVEELLIARPPALAERFDLARGALDAWVHPQVRRPATAGPRAGLAPRAATAVAVLGGILFVASGLRIAGSRAIGPDGYRDNGFAIPLLILGMLLTGIAALLVATETGPRRAAGIAIAGSLLTMLPWPILIIGFFTYIGATIGSGILLIARRRVAGITLLAIGVILPMFNTEDERALATVPVGILWIVFAVLWRHPAVTMPGARRTPDAVG